MNDYYSVRGRMNIELYCVRAQLDRTQKGGYRVFGQGIVCATMRDFERGATSFVQGSSRSQLRERRTYELSTTRSISLNGGVSGASTF
jgi:hypothetical protein